MLPTQTLTIAPGEQVSNNMLSGYITRNGIVLRDAIVKDITEVKIEPLTPNAAIIDVVSRCAGIDDDVVGIAEPMMTVIDTGHSGHLQLRN